MTTIMRAGIVGLGFASWALVACLDLSNSEESSRPDAGNDAQTVGDGSFPDALSTGGKSGTGGTTGTGGSGATGGTSGTGGSSACGAGMRCAPPLPDTSWSGPFFRWQGLPLDVPACPSGNPAFIGGTTYTAGVHTCNCQCTDSLSCPGTYTVDVYDGTTCTTPCATLQVNAGCQSSFPIACVAPQKYVVHPYAPSGTCTANLQKLISKSAFSDTLLACATASGGGCSANQLCVPEAPAPFETKLCIGRNDDVPCSGAYPQKITGYTDLLDTRDCGLGSCQCVASGSCVLGISPCSDLSGVSITQNGSGCINMTMQNFRLGSPTSTLSCKPSGSVETKGSVTPTGAFTLCCEA